MHRHGYKGRKFGRERDQRNALMRGLAIALIEHGAIVTTLPKAKDLRPIVEKMITKARKGGLSNRRALIANLNVKSYRVGDNAELARIEFVDEIKEVAKPAKAEAADSKSEAKSADAAESSDKEDK